MSIVNHIAANLEHLQGKARRQLLMVATLYFAILFLECAVSHMPLLLTGWLNLAAVPIVWMAVSVLALIAVLSWPSAITGGILRVVMLVAAIVGVIGVFPHFAANGFTLHQFGSLAGIQAIFSGDPGAQWPLAITFGAFIGFVGSFGIAQDQEFRGTAVGWPTSIAFALLVVGIVLSRSYTTLGWGSTAVVAASFLLVVIMLISIASVYSEQGVA